MVPVLFNGSCDTIAFNTWLQEMLCPLLDDRHVVIIATLFWVLGFYARKLVENWTSAKKYSIIILDVGMV